MGEGELSSGVRRGKPGPKSVEGHLNAQIRDLRQIAGTLLDGLVKDEAYRKIHEALVARHFAELGSRLDGLTVAVNRLADAASARALSSEQYSVQAIEVLGLLRLEVSRLPHLLHTAVTLDAARSVEPVVGSLASAVGDAAIVLVPRPTQAAA